MKEFVENYGPEFGLRLAEHLGLVLGSVLVAALIAFSLGFTLWDQPRWRSGLLAVCNGVQTIPGLALLAFLLPVLGIGWPPTLVALVLYTMLPILRATLTSFAAVPQDLQEAGILLGMSRSQLVARVMIPQSAPFLVSGLRTALVWGVSLATLGAFIGAGGLGDFINRGIALNDTRLVLLGAVPAAGLAMGLDALLGWTETRAQHWRTGT
jgi:osmoprotectant transport system permease protein